QVLTLNFAVEVSKGLRLDFVDQALQVIDSNGALPTGPLQTGQQLFALIGNAASVLLDHQQLVRLFDSLISRIASLAGWAFASAANHRSAFGSPRVDDLVPGMFFAKRALHLADAGSDLDDPYPHILYI